MLVDQVKHDNHLGCIGDRLDQLYRLVYHYMTRLRLEQNLVNIYRCNRLEKYR